MFISIKLLLTIIIFSFSFLCSICIAFILYFSGLEAIRKKVKVVSSQRVLLSADFFSRYFNYTTHNVESFANTTRTQIPNLYESDQSVYKMQNLAVYSMAKSDLQVPPETTQVVLCRYRNADNVIARGNKDEMFFQKLKKVKLVFTEDLLLSLHLVQMFH